MWHLSQGSSCRLLLLIQFDPHILEWTPTVLNQPHGLTLVSSAGCRLVMGGNGAETESLSGKQQEGLLQLQLQHSNAAAL